MSGVSKDSRDVRYDMNKAEYREMEYQSRMKLRDKAIELYSKAHQPEHIKSTAELREENLENIELNNLDYAEEKSRENDSADWE